MSDDDPILVGDLQESLDIDQLQTIKAVLKTAGYEVDVDFPAAEFTVKPMDDAGGVQLSEEYRDLDSEEITDKVREEHSTEGEATDEDEPEEEDTDLDTSETDEETATGEEVEEKVPCPDCGKQVRPKGLGPHSLHCDAGDEQEESDPAESETEESGPSKRQKRIERLTDGMTPGQRYSSREAAAIMTGKDEDDITAGDRAKFSDVYTDAGIEKEDNPSGPGCLYVIPDGDEEDPDFSSTDRDGSATSSSADEAGDEPGDDDPSGNE